jgi:hypothetical protein
VVVLFRTDQVALPQVFELGGGHLYECTSLYRIREISDVRQKKILLPVKHML